MFGVVLGYFSELQHPPLEIRGEVTNIIDNVCQHYDLSSKKLYYKMYMIEMSISFIGSCHKHSPPIFKPGQT